MRCIPKINHHLQWNVELCMVIHGFSRNSHRFVVFANQVRGILPIISNFNAPRFLAQVKVVVAFQFVNLLHPDINCWMHLGKRIILHEFKIILNSFVCALFYAQRNSLWILFATFFLHQMQPSSSRCTSSCPNLWTMIKVQK